MLSKLLKYEFKASGRIFGVVYLIILGLCVTTGLINRVNFSQDASIMSRQVFGAFNTMGVLLEIATGMFFFAAVIITTVVIIRRYYQGVYKDEGYLLHTLPVRPWEILAGKLIPAVVWTIATIAVMGVSMMAMLLLINAVSPAELFEDMTDAFAEITRNGAWDEVVLACPFALFTLISTILQVYTAISLGQLAGKHKVGLALVFWFAIDLVRSQISLLTGWFSTTYFALRTFVLFGDPFESPAVLWGFLISALVWSALFWAASQYLLTKKLNLE